MAEKSERRYLVYLFFFAAGFLGTTLFVLLARRTLRCVLAYGLMDLAVVLLIALLCGVGVGLAAFLSEEVKRVASSLYFGAALVLVGFIVAASLAPGPPEEACLALLPGATAIQPVIPQPTAPPAPPTPTVPPSPAAGRFLSPIVSPSPTVQLGPTSTSSPTYVVPTALPYPMCGPPTNWVKYVVCPGDTLYSLAKWFGVTTSGLGSANCLANNVIYAGQLLWVPPWPPAPACASIPAATAVSPTVSPGPVRKKTERRRSRARFTARMYTREYPTCREARPGTCV